MSSTFYQTLFLDNNIDVNIDNEQKATSLGNVQIHAERCINIVGSTRNSDLEHEEDITILCKKSGRLLKGSIKTWIRKAIGLFTTYSVVQQLFI